MQGLGLATEYFVRMVEINAKQKVRPDLLSQLQDQDAFVRYHKKHGFTQLFWDFDFGVMPIYKKDELNRAMRKVFVNAVDYSMDLYEKRRNTGAMFVE